jgi:cystine transport system permease protein
MLDLVKASSLAAMITVPELFQQAKIVGGREFDYMTMYILVALIYWAVCSAIALLQDFLEKRTEVYIKK